MQAFSARWTAADRWSCSTGTESTNAQLLLAFGPVNPPDGAWFDEVRARWPDAHLVYVTAGGQITDGEVRDDEVVVTGLGFDRARVCVVSLDGAGSTECESLGMQLARGVAAEPDLRHVLIFSDGLQVNGAAFTAGVGAALPAGVTVSGGLASDGTTFATTGIGLDGPPVPGRVVAVGLCGESLAIGTGSVGGWEPFGPERLVSKAHGPILHELDGERALDVYRRYLGDLSSELPGSALLFPLALTSPGGDTTVVRTILGIDENEGSLRFAGDVPQGHTVRLMRATNDRLLDGAASAAREAHAGLNGVPAAAVLCISCIGRRAVLRSRIEEEVEEVSMSSGTAVVSGYYSNGEIAPGAEGGLALLHNQTMTVTAIGER